jgi:hypothetical protein
LIAIHLARVALKLRAGVAAFSFAPLTEPWPLNRQRLAIVALTAGFIFVIPFLGLTLGLFTLTAALMVLLRAGGWRAIVATSAIVAGTAYLLFIALLNSRLPRGPIEKLLAALF